MKFAKHLRRARRFTGSLIRTVLVLLLCLHLLTGCDGTIAARLQSRSPEAEAGLRDYQRPLLVDVPGGVVNAAGGNLFLHSGGLSLETALGDEEVRPVYNSAAGDWRFGIVDMTYDGTTFVDSAGTVYDVTSVADASALPGSVWIKVDADTIAAKGGMIFEFAGGALVERHRDGQACPRILYRELSTGALEVFQQDCAARGEWSTFNTVLFTLTRDAAGRVVEVVDRGGHVALYDYDDEGRLASARDGLDVEQGWPGDRFEYGPLSRRLTAVTNAHGERIEYEYFSPTLLGVPRLQFATQTAAAGEGSLQVRFDYSPGATAGAFETVVTDPMGDRRRFFFDERRRVLEIVFEAVGESERFGYTGAALRPSSRTLANGVVESYTRDAFGDLLTVVQPSGNVVEITYADANSAIPFERALASVRDGLGSLGTWTYTQDEPVDYKRLATAANGEGEPVRFAYHPSAGYTRVASVTFASGVVREFGAYDALGRPTRVSHGDIGTNVAFDAVGNRTGAGDGASPEIGGILARRYDADRNPVEVAVADTDGQQSAIVLERGSDGRILAIDRPPLGLGAGPDHRFRYDSLGRAIEREERVDGVWRSTFFAYDGRGRRTGETLANGMRDERAYDQRGRLVSRRSFRDDVLEGEIFYTYANGNLVQIDDSRRGVEVHTYDAAGRTALVRYADGESIEYAYDLRSRTVRETFRLSDGTAVKAIERAYDLADRETRLYDDGELVVDRTFVDGRIDCTETGNGLTRCFHYEPVLGLRDGAVTTDASLAVVATTTLSAGLTTWPANWEMSAATTVPALGIAEANFTVGPGTDPSVPGSEVGKRVLAWDDGSGGASQDYAFDALSNPVDDADGDRYDYNPEGNRLLSATIGGSSLNYTYDAAGFADSRDGVPIAWTAEGRMAAYGPFEIEWDLQGRPLTVADSSTEPATVRDWSYWGGRIEVDGDGFLVALDLGEVVLGFGGARRYRHFDFRGNVSFVSDDDGNVVTLYAYGPYGVNAVSGDATDPTRFVGRPEIGPLMLLGVRVYDPLVGRFLSPDPVFQLLNQYTYTFGNPVWFSDPTGREPTTADGVNVGLAAFGMTLAIVGVAMSSTPLGVGLALVGVGLTLYAFWDAIRVQSPNYRAPQPTTTSTGCACVPTVTMGADPNTAESPSGSHPSGGGNEGVVVPPGLPGGGFDGSGGFGGAAGGFSAVPSCGLTGIEFVWFVGFVLRRRNRKRSAR